MSDFCERHLGAPAAEEAFATTSVGVVRGVRLEDGRRVVVKAHQPRQRREFLAGVRDVQAHLHRNGFPCPEPLAGPEPLGDGLALVEELVDEGTYEDAHRPEARRAMAELLARHVGLTRGLTAPGLAGGWTLFTGEALWPEPHSPIFDFEATASGAEWIDEIAARARPRALEAARRHPFPGHTYWSAEHFRFAGERIAVVYDWDSLALASEAHVRLALP